MTLPTAQPTRRGFVLLMTLLLIGVAAVALAGVSRASLARQLDALHAQRDLQRRWGTLTCQWAVLPRITDTLSAVEKESLMPVTEWLGSLPLTGQRFDLVLADEQAKLDVAALAQRVGVSRAERRVHGLLREAGCDVSVRLRPVASQQDRLAPIGSLAQVLPAASPRSLFEPHRGPAVAPTRYITCWGGGKVNYQRAPGPVLHACLEGALTRLEIGELISLRDEIPDLDLPKLTANLDFSKDKKTAMAQLLTDRSSFYSLRVSVRDDKRVWHKLKVSQITQEQASGQQGQPQGQSQDPPQQDPPQEAGGSTGHTPVASFAW